MGSLNVGVLYECALPLPIPNREVKALMSDDTSGFGWWESRICRLSRTSCGFLIFTSPKVFSILLHNKSPCVSISQVIQLA